MHREVSFINLWSYLRKGNCRGTSEEKTVTRWGKGEWQVGSQISCGNVSYLAEHPDLTFSKALKKIPLSQAHCALAQIKVWVKKISFEGMLSNKCIWQACIVADVS